MGPMHWGHCKSDDFVKREYLPAAMAPDETYDAGGCYSGSAIEVEGKHVLVYTGVIDRYLEDGSHDYRQVQCIAKGNGIDYWKHKGNPVITGKSLPKGSSTEDFRDPKIWEDVGMSGFLSFGEQAYFISFSPGYAGNGI